MKPKKQTKDLKVRAFSLIEILVVVAILAILIALLSPAISGALRKGNETQRLTAIREIGSMIHLYSTENSGNLPGPLWPGQIPVYDPARDGRLAGFLAPFLDLDADGGAVTVSQFLPPALDRGRPQGVTDENFRTYVMNMSVRDREQEWFSPWGNLAGETDETPPTPVNHATLAARTPPVWGFSEADQTHPRVASAPWEANTIPEPLSRGGRLAWFFDGSVTVLRNEEIETPL
jgi:prepilin-type N-terminal cleavage/methylation domain-containing protein